MKFPPKYNSSSQFDSRLTIDIPSSPKSLSRIQYYLILQQNQEQGQEERGRQI